MSTLYNLIKGNVDKLNSIYKNIGFSIHKDTNFISPIDRSVTLEWLAGGIRAKDYPQNYSGEVHISFGAYSVMGADYIIRDLSEKFSVTPAFIQKKDFVVSKNKNYGIIFNPKNAGQNVAIKFGENILYPDTIYDKDDKNVFKFYNVNITPPPTYYDLGIYSHYQYNYNVGDTYHIESTDSSNPYFLGNCDVKVTYYNDVETPVPYTFPRHDITIRYQITNIYRQPSQSPEPNQYLKIKYHDDVISIFEDSFL